MTRQTADTISAIAFVGIAFAVSQPLGWAALVLAAVLVARGQRLSR
jgi:hypothetical protein